VGFQCYLSDFWRNRPKGWPAIMVDDDTLVELLRRFLKDPRTSDAENPKAVQFGSASL